jgi:hypothetical protein
MEDFDKYLDQLVENFFDTGRVVLNETTDTINWDKIGKVIRDPNKSEQIYELLIDMFPNAKEVIDYNYYGDNEEPSPNDTFAEMKSFLWNIDKNTIKGPDLRLSTGFEIDGEYKKDLEKKYDDYVGGKIDKYFRDSSNDPRDTTKEGFKNLPPILVMGKKVIDGNHRTFLAQKVGAELPTFEMVEEPNTHPNAQKILSIIHPNDSDEDGIPNRLDISQEPNLNEHDSILDRIVEEFFDTGKVVLNEYSDNIRSFFLQSKDANMNRINANKNLNGLDKLDKLIESAIEWDKVIGILGKMGADDLSKISRGGDKEWSTFKFAINLNGISNINDAVMILQGQTNSEIILVYKELINKIHYDSKGAIKTEEIIGRYEKLRDSIVELGKTSFKNDGIKYMLDKIDSNIKLNSISSNDWIHKYKEIKKQYYGNKSSEDYVKNLKELKDDYNELPPDKKEIIIKYFKHQYDKKGGFGFDIGNFVEWIDNIIKNQEEETERVRKDLETYRNKYLSTITPEQSEESFDKIVDDIYVEEVKKDEWDKDIAPIFAPILSEYSVDDEELREIVTKIKEKKDKLTKLETERTEKGEEHGSRQIPLLSKEIENLEEHLKIIDPIKVFFDTNNEWRNYLGYCKGTNDEEYSKIDEFLKKTYGKTSKNYQGVLNITVKTFDPNSFKKSQVNDITNIRKNCKSKTFIQLISELSGTTKRETIQTNLKESFEANTDLVEKCIRLVDKIFKSIIENGIYVDDEKQQKSLLKKYKSYMNMVKIYSGGEDQKEKLNQLAYDLNQLKNVVDSYNSLTDKAESPSPSEEDTQEEGAKSLNRDGLRNLLNDISKNSWDKEEIKDYFVKVREHNNVAYEKSFEKECDDTQYFEKAKGGDNPRIIDVTQNNTHLVDYILSADTENKYITTEKIVETVFGEVKSLLNDESAFEKRLKKYDLKVLSDVILTNGNDTITLSPSDEKFIEVKLTKPQDYHFSEFFGVYKSTKSKVYKRMKNLVEGVESDVEENFGRYNGFVDGLVEKLISEEGRKIIDIIKSKLQGIFFSNYEFCPIDNIKFSWSTVGQGKEGGREKRVTLRVEPDISKLYTWKEGNPNCDRFKFVGCDKTPGCPQNESTDRIDNIIENFFDTGNFDI